MPSVFVTANSEQARQVIGAVLIRVFEGTQAECETYTQSHNTDDTTPITGWSPVSDGDLEIRD
jgi:hypothetical protein